MMNQLLTFVLTALTLVAASCGHLQPSKHYPARWWTPVAKEGAPSWEILPEEAKAGEVVLSKRNELGLLSNFAATPFVFHGVRYASVEGFWQMMKYPEGADDPRAKVEQNSEVRRVLLATGDLVLKPDHHQEADAPAAWRYYEIMMEIRGELRARSGGRGGIAR